SKHCAFPTGYLPVYSPGPVPSVTLFWHYDTGTAAMGALVIIHILTVIIQRNFYTPHFNPVWVPVGLLSAKCLSDLLEKPDPSNPYFILGSILTLLMIMHFARIIIKNFAAEKRDVIGYMHPATGAAFRLAETIGSYIRQNSDPHEKLLVWGDHPSIYLYAGREALDTRLMFIYANLGRVANENLLIPTMRNNPPEMVLFFNYKVKDDWDIKKIQNTIGVPYRHMHRFCIQNEQGHIQLYPNGIPLDFNLYHRDDTIYREIVLDRAILALRTGRDENARSELSKLEKEHGHFFEPILRNQVLSMHKKDVEDFLLKELEHIKGYLEKSVILRILGNIYLDNGNIDPAVDCYRKALELNPDDYRSMTAMGEILFADGNTQSAMDYFKQALTINPYAVEAWNDLGVLLNSAGNPGEARTCFEKSLQINPDHPEAGSNLADLHGYKQETSVSA
ncbi:MAG TPA: tetratricopeptide repeat protein, partial [Deltaproteobacteria bacterium]|nr:tetratricopeptide repeat protein [Deltaproteobacteria bacterium]